MDWNSPPIQALLATIPIYIIISMGWLSRRLKWVTPAHDSALMRLSVDIALPCFILSNMLGNTALRSVSVSLTTIGLGVLGIGLSLVICWGISKLLRLKVGDGQRTFVVATGIHNYGFFVIPLVAMLHSSPGDPMMGLVITHNVGCDMVVWSVGLLLVSSQTRFSYKLFLRGPIFVVFIALFLIWTGLDQYVPGFVLNALKLMGGCLIPLNLIIFGNLLYDLLGKPTQFSPKIVFTATAVRVLLLPWIFIALAVFLPVNMELKRLLIFQSLAPASVTSALIARHFGGHPDIAVQIILATCAASFVTLPLWFKVGFALIGG